MTHTPSLVLPSMEVQPKGLALSGQGLANLQHEYCWYLST